MEILQTMRNYSIKIMPRQVVIENTFGLLKGRFRQLLKLDFSLAEKDSNFILACCVLHNLCTDDDDDDLVPEQPPVEDHL